MVMQPQPESSGNFFDDLTEDYLRDEFGIEINGIDNDLQRNFELFLSKGMSVEDYAKFLFIANLYQFASMHSYNSTIADATYGSSMEVAIRVINMLNNKQNEG